MLHVPPAVGTDRGADAIADHLDREASSIVERLARSGPRRLEVIETACDLVRDSIYDVDSDHHAAMRVDFEKAVEGRVSLARHQVARHGKRYLQTRDGSLDDLEVAHAPAMAVDDLVEISRRLLRLDPRRRDLVLLRLYGMTVKEVCAATGCTGYALEDAVGRFGPP